MPRRERPPLDQLDLAILRVLKEDGRVTNTEVADRVGCILTFLALLEIIRLRLARAFTSHHQEDILIVIADEVPHAPMPAEGAIDA